MRKIILILTISFFSLLSCQQKLKNVATDKKNTSVCTDKCQAKNKDTSLACKLSSPELLKRKETVLTSLKRQVLEKKELNDGYAFRFNGSDKMIDELTEFIKTERECCGFFTFNLSISGDKSEVWLELRSKDGAKDFIHSEMGL